MPRNFHPTHDPYPAAVDGPTAITRDGKLVEVVADSGAAFARIQRLQPQSVCWAVTYDGWGWRPATAEEELR